MSAFLSAVQKKVKYVQLMASCGCEPGSQKHTNLMSDGMAGVLQLARVAKSISADDAVRVKELVSDVFEEPNVQTMMMAIHGKVNLGSATGMNDDIKHKHLWQDNYMTQPMWDLQTNPDSDLQSKLMASAQLIRSLGGNHPTEPTFAMAVSIATQSERAPTDVLEALRDLKAFHKSMQDTVDGPREYPESPDEFQRLHPALYAAAYPVDAPIASKWSEAHRRMVLIGGVCRSTKTGFGSAARSDIVPYSRSSGHSSNRRISGHQPSPALVIEGMPGFKWSAPQAPQTLQQQIEPLAAALRLAMAPQQPAPHRMPTLEFDAGSARPSILPPVRDSPETPSPSLKQPASPPHEAAKPPDTQLVLKPPDTQLVLQTGVPITPLQKTALKPPSMTEVAAMIREKIRAPKSTDKAPEAEANPEAVKPRPLKPAKGVMKSMTSKGKVTCMKSKAGKSKAGKSKDVEKCMKSGAPTTCKKEKLVQRDVREKNPSMLTFKKPGKCGPRYYGKCTVYTDVVNRLWRIKPDKNRRDHKMFAWKETPQDSWQSLVKYVKKIS